MVKSKCVHKKFDNFYGKIYFSQSAKTFLNHILLSIFSQSIL